MEKYIEFNIHAEMLTHTCIPKTLQTCAYIRKILYYSWLCLAIHFKRELINPLLVILNVQGIQAR